MNKPNNALTNERRLKAFMKKIDRRDSDDCWEWLGGKVKGYGQLRDGSRRVLAHRYSWQVFKGPIPVGKLVLHKCNNKACVNPNHLYLGNECDNAVDLKSSGFVPMSCILTNEQVINIRKDYASGKISLGHLAKKYAVSVVTVHNVVRRKTYKDAKNQDGDSHVTNVASAA